MGDELTQDIVALREELQLSREVDSANPALIRLAIRLEEKFDVEFSPRDYPRLCSVDGCVHLLSTSRKLA